MLFRRKSRKDRLVASAARIVSGRKLTRAVGVATGTLALVTAASSGVSALRQKSS